MVRELTLDEVVSATKDTDLTRAVSNSVVEVPPKPSSNSPVTYNSAMDTIWFIGQTADSITPWGAGWKRRDAELRRFITQENIFASALGIICSRNSGFSWTLDGPDRVVTAVQHILETANMGKGWHDLIVKTTIDLCTQDNGAFWEIVRDGDGPTAPLVGINSLDSQRCQHTGNPYFPVIYTDMYSVPHLLAAHQVIELAEMPIPQETLYGLQYCTLTRLLRKLQSTVNMDTYDYEKSGGMNVGEIHLVQGITSQQIKDAVLDAKARAIGAGNARYMDAVVAGTLDPKANVGHDTIQLKSKPADYDPEVWFKHYINLIAMAFESDYQEFAPLPGGGLGTGAQSEMLHLKSRGKGPGTFMKLITYALNFRVLPKNIKFLFDEQDLEAEMADAEVRAVRAQTRAVRLASMEIVPEIARQMANDEGDLAVEYLDLMDEMDLTPDVMVESSTTAESQLKPVNRTARQSLRRNIDSRQPARVPSIRPPTPLNAKQPAATATVKENEMVTTASIEGLKVMANQFAGMLANIQDQLNARGEVTAVASEKEIELEREKIALERERIQLENTPRTIRKVVERDKEGRISAVTEIPE